MSNPSQNPIPQGMHTLTPHLVCAGAADAIEFYKKAFDAIEEARLPGPDGKLMHAMVRIGDSPLMLVDESPQWGMLGAKALKGSPVTIHLYVDDVDATVERAVAAGAKVTMPVAEHVLGRSLRHARRPVRSSLVRRDACARRLTRGDARCNEAAATALIGESCATCF